VALSIADQRPRDTAVYSSSSIQVRCRRWWWLWICRRMWEYWMPVLRCLRIRLQLRCSSLHLSIYLSASKTSAALNCSSFRENVATLLMYLRTTASIANISWLLIFINNHW